MQYACVFLHMYSFWVLLYSHKTKCSMAVKFPSSSGRLPVKLLSAPVKLTKAVRFPNSAGISLEKEFMADTMKKHSCMR